MIILHKAIAPLIVLSLILSLMVGCAKTTRDTELSSGTTPDSSITVETTGTTSTTSTTNSAGITASFTTISYILTLSVPSGGGVINAVPGSSNGSYASGTTVTLNATADPDHAFSNWGGDASGVNETTTILMDSDKSVTAYFIPM